MDFTPFISPVATVLVAVVAAYMTTRDANTKQFNVLMVQITKLSTQVEDLKTDVEKHNSVVERVFKIESEMRTAFHRIDELKEADKHLEDKMERHHEKP